MFSVVISWLVFVQGTAPTISIDNIAGCQLYLSKYSLQATITTAKSSEINVLVPGAGADSDWVRNPHSHFASPLNLVCFKIWLYTE